jgi:hypothetical protein
VLAAKNSEALQNDLFAAAELLFTEGARLSKDQVDLRVS